MRIIHKMHITFIQTGGTIDKDYPRGETTHGYEFEIGAPAVQAIIPQSHALFTHEVIELLKKDSLDMTDADREAIRSTVVAQTTDKIVITHGTDTMAKTAAVLATVAADKTIVLTGAMLPEKFSTSDARFNIGIAVAAVQTLPHGVYVALYGRVVPADEFPAVHAQYEQQVHA
jgi:L-asparaginase